MNGKISNVQKDASAPLAANFSIFNYFDYREFLAEYFRHRKSVNPHFSYRVFARRAGYKSAGMYIQIVSGKLNLTRDTISLFINGMELQPAEAEYLTLMVQFTHARTAEGKQHWFEKMVSLLPYRARVLTEDQANYYRNWFHVAVRESLSVMEVSDDPSELADFLQPAISSKQAADSLKLLASLGLISKDGNGHWRATDASLESTPALGPILIHPFQQSLIELGKEALKRFSREKRNVSCITLSISEEGRRRLNLKVDQFLREVAALVQSDNGLNQVCQLNVQLFPLTKEKP